jgi:hypothetical protein
VILAMLKNTLRRQINPPNVEPKMMDGMETKMP